MLLNQKSKTLLKKAKSFIKNYFSKSMSNQIIVYKPRGKVIPKNLLAKIQKEYVGTKVNYIYKLEGDIWRYSNFATEFKDSFYSKLTEEESAEYIFSFEKYNVYNGKNKTLVHYRPADEPFDSWFLSFGTGIFPILAGACDEAPDVLFNNFLKFMNLSSLHSFLTNLCSKQRDVRYITVNNGREVKKYGNWEEVDGIWLSNSDFIHKLPFDAKAAAKAIIAFFTNKENFMSEVRRIESLSDLQIRKEAEKIEGLPEILSKII